MAAPPSPPVRRPGRRSRLAIGAAVAVALVLPGAAGAAGVADPAQTGGGRRACARRLEEAQRIDMESFRDYDRETWRDIHTEDAVSVFPDGTVITGRDAIVAALARHFDDREALWTWTELSRRVDGCRTAHILYETVYELPSVGFRSRAITGVTYTYERGRWLVVADQGTALP